MCREGGCGACLATAEVFDYSTGQNVSYSINTVFNLLFSILRQLDLFIVL